MSNVKNISSNVKNISSNVIDMRATFQAELEYNEWHYSTLEDLYIRDRVIELRNEFVRNGNLPCEALKLAEMTLRMAYKARQLRDLPDNVVDHPRKNLYVSGGFKI